MSEFDFEKRRQERSKKDRGTTDKASVLLSKAQELVSDINKFFGAKFPAQFDQSVKDSTITLTKKGGGSALSIEVIADDKFKLSGGSGPGGFGADVAASMGDAGKDDMMDTIDEWFEIAS